MLTYLIIDSNGLVVNSTLWDGMAPWSAPDGCIAVQAPADSEAGIGWTYSDGVFTEPVSE